MPEIPFMRKLLPGLEDSPYHGRIHQFQLAHHFFQISLMQPDVQDMHLSQDNLILGDEKGKLITLETERVRSPYDGIAFGRPVHKKPAGKVDRDDLVPGLV